MTSKQTLLFLSIFLASSNLFAAIVLPRVIRSASSDVNSTELDNNSSGDLDNVNRVFSS